MIITVPDLIVIITPFPSCDTDVKEESSGKSIPCEEMVINEVIPEGVTLEDFLPAVIYFPLLNQRCNVIHSLFFIYI